jgi:Insertion element 4 transposase N-terminal/Transposase DDE domain
MQLERELSKVADIAPERFDDVRRHLDPAWVELALQATGTATLRRRRLPAELVVWLVIAMALFRNRSIVDVVDALDLALPGPLVGVAKSGIPPARDRLGAEPLKWLFNRVAEAWAHASAGAHRWRGLSVYGVDGSTLRVADSDVNREHFGGSNGPRGPSAYPLVRVVTLMALRSHLLAAAEFGPYAKGEHTYAVDLWPSVPDDSVTVVDKGFFAAKILIPLAGRGRERHWLTRAKKNLRWKVIRRLGRGDELVEMKVSRAARAKDPSLPATWQVRAIRYQRKGFRPEVLLTSLLDAEKYPASEIVALYHERWELELGFDEIKTEMLNREEALRSKSPRLVEQELWGVLIAYNLVRREMEHVAKEARVPPTRISFVAALRLIVDEWIWSANTSPGAIPSRLRDMRANLKRFILPKRRSERKYPRAVKIKMSNYPRKRRVEKTTASMNRQGPQMVGTNP